MNDRSESTDGCSFVLKGTDEQGVYILNYSKFGYPSNVILGI